MLNNRNLESALVYVKRFDFAVLPVHSISKNGCSCDKKDCTHPGKHPRNSGGVKEATKDLEQVLYWWRKWPNANIGVACGKISNITVLDVDIKPNCDGRETLRELELQNSPLPMTPMQISGSGGNHYIFKYEPSLINRVDFLPALDIRNDGGYIIAAPSIHETGKEYNWELLQHIKEHSIAKMPDWLINESVKKNTFNGSKSLNKDPDRWARILAGISEGGRNDAATSLAGHLFYKKVDLLIIVWIMQQWNSFNKPPLNERELEKVILSVGKMRGLRM